MSTVSKAGGAECYACEDSLRAGRLPGEPLLPRKAGEAGSIRLETRYNLSLKPSFTLPYKTETRL